MRLRRFVITTALAALVAWMGTTLRAGTLSSVAPLGASAGISINITGTGFDPSAANNRVTFTSASGVAVTAPGTAILTLDQASGLRRLSVTVPDGLPTGTTALRVQNTITQETSVGKSIEVVTLTLPTVTSGAPGTTGLAVRITGSPNAAFTAGTRVNLGAGVTVTSTTIESATSLVATASIAATAALGARDVNILTGTQTLLLRSGFAVATAPPVNHPPTGTAGGPYSGTVGQAVTFTGSGTDPDNDPLTFTWNFGDGSAPASGSSATHSYAQAGDFTATLTISDGRGGSAAPTAAVHIALANRAPTGTAGGPYSGTVGQAVTFTGSGTDPDNDPLTFTWNFGDASAPASGSSATHTYAQAGDFTATLTISDGRGGSVAPTAAVHIAPANQAPVVTSGVNQSITLPATAALAGTATDDGLPNGTLTTAWSTVSGPAAVIFGNAASLTTTATFSQAGTYVLRLTASDSALTASSDVTITVAPHINQAPIITSAPVTTGRHGIAYAYQATATDADGDPVSFSLTAAPTGAAIDATRGLISWIPSGAEIGDLPFTVAASDGNGGTTSQTFTVHVTDVTAPVITLTGPTRTLPGTAVTITANTSDDVAVAGVTFTVDSGSPTDVTAAPYQQVLSIPANAPAGTLYHVSATARDTSGNTRSDDLTVAVTAQPDTEPPAVALHAPAQASPGSTLSLSATAGDNVGIQSVAFSTSTAPIGSTTTAPYDATFIVPANASVGSSITFVARAVDFSGNASQDTRTVTIVSAADTTAAQIQLVVPPGVTQGAPVTIAATITNNVPVSRVDFLVNGVVVATATDAPYQVTIDLPPDTPTDAPVQIEAHAVNFFGAETDETAGAPVAGGAANRDPVALAGGPYAGQTNAAIAFDGTGSSDPDGDPLTYRWDFGDGTSGSGPSLVHAYTAAGSYTVLLTVDDGRGGSGTASAIAAAQAAPDAIPPVITLQGPTQALPGTSVTLTATAGDNVGVTNVHFDVSGAAASDAAVAPFTRAVNVPPVAAPGDAIHVTATARDAAGNTSSATSTITIGTEPDTTKPTITLHVPTTAAPGAGVQIAADASDDVGVKSVVFLVNGSSVGTVSAPPYQFAYQLAPTASPGAVVNIVAQAFDYTGNEADTSASLTIVAVAPTTPPIVTLTAPAQVTAGGTLALSATASDTVGVANVSFFVAGARIATLTTPPYQAQFVVPAASAGSVLRVEARATNFSTLQSSDSADTRIVAPAALGQGTLTGVIYDDSRGLPLAGASVTLVGMDAGGAAYAQTATSDVDGRFVITANEGHGVVQISQSGWTRVDRPVTLTAGQAIDIVDARLTPNASIPQAFSAVLGGNSSFNETTLGIPPGALASDTPFVVSAIGQQGIEGLLPPGWTPVGGADILPHGVSLANAGALTTPNTLKLATGTALIVATWDESASAWRMVSTSTVGGDGSTLQATVPASGQFVWLLADQQPAAPPTPQTAALLLGATSGAVPDTAAAVVDPQPKILFFRPGAQSNVQGRITTTSPLPSGVVVLSRISEAYTFRSGSQIHMAPFQEQLVFYQTPGTPTILAANYPATPSLTFDPLTLDQGVITVELDTAPPSALQMQTVGAQGGTIAAATGESAQFAAGALASNVPVTVQQMSLADTGLTLPPGLTYLDAVVVTVPGGLASPMTLAVPRPSGLPDGTLVLVAREQEIGGQTRLILVANGRLTATQIVTDMSLGGAPGAFEGAATAGRYLFLRANTDIGFATGTVSGVDGLPFAGALLTSSNLGIGALSRQGGAYTAAAAIGAVTFTALDVTRADSGTAVTTLAAAGAIVQLPLKLQASVPVITGITPTDGSANFPLTNPIVVTFSEPIDPATVNGANSGNIALVDGSGASAAGTIALSTGNTVLTFRPASILTSATSYTFTVAAGVADVSGRTLAAPATVHFISLNTAAPTPPAAGTITSTIPVNGQTTITAAQGTADPHNTVSVVNVTTGASTPVQVQANGGFVVSLPAVVTDKLQLQITNAAGASTTISIARFTQTNADGSVSAVIDANGGHIDGPGGVAVDVPVGAFAQGTVVTVNPIAESDFPVDIGDAGKQVFGYQGGIKLDLGGAVPARYINVSIPPGASDHATDQWVVGQVVNFGGAQNLQIVDTAKLINDRVTTSSPPCPGVTGEGIYGIYKSSQSVGLNYAQMQPTPGGMKVVYENPSLLFVMPFLAYAPDVPAPVCFPVLTGRVTVQQNSLRLTISGDQLTPAERELVVTNQSTGDVLHFPRNVVQPIFTVNGRDTDTYQVLVNGSTPVTFFGVAPGPSTGQAVISLNPDKISVPASSYTINNLTSGQSFPFTQSFAAVDLQIAGASTDTFKVAAVDVSGQQHDVNATVTLPAPPFDQGNLIVRAQPGTIDPDQAQIDAYNALHPDAPIGGAPVIKVTLQDTVTLQKYDIPLSLIEAGNGGFAMSFDGIYTNTFVLTADYADGKQAGTTIPNFKVIVENPLTGRVLTTITGQSPPPGAPLNVGNLTGGGGVAAPVIISGPSSFSGIDPSAQLALRFSQAMDTATLTAANVILEEQQDQSWVAVATSVQLSADQTVATIVPTSALGLGDTYRIRFSGVKSSSGQPLFAQTLTFNTFTPKRICQANTSCDISFQVFEPGTSTPIPLKDLDILRRGSPSGTLTTNLVAATFDRNSYQLLTYDVTDPTHVQLLGTDSGGSAPLKQRVKVLPQVSFGLHDAFPPNSTCGTGNTFTGDVAVTSTFNTYYSFLSFWNVSNLNAPCLLGNKLLTATPDTVTDFSRQGTVHELGFVKGVATLNSSTGPIAYAAVSQVGLMMADLGKNIPERTAAHTSPVDDIRIQEGLYAGDYVDVASTGDHLVAIEATAHRLDIFDANLTVLTSVPIYDTPRRLIYTTGYPVDFNHDGQLTGDEQRNVAFVTGDSSITFVDLTDLASPRLLGSIAMPGLTRELDVDPARRRLYAGGLDANTNSVHFYVIDASDLTQSGLIDQDHDARHWDDRIIWSASYSDIEGLRVDPDRGLAYIPTDRGLDILALTDTCCDLAVDMTAARTEAPSGPVTDLDAEEKQALQTGISSGLDLAAGQCGIGDALASNQIWLLEQGSGACTWRGDCAGNPNYQPGVSDHDYEVFFPASMIPSPPLSISPAVKCTINALTQQFTDSNGNAKQIAVGGATFTFDDITFYPLGGAAFNNASLDVAPLPGTGSDASGDMGLGRRQLLFGKLLLEGEYVDVPKYEQNGVNLLAGRPLEEILSDLRTKTGIPALEGFEWATLQEYALVKSKALLRIVGASDSRSSFHDLYLKQLHSAGKAGIRAAMARMVADTDANQNLLQVTKAAYAGSACLNIISTDPPETWQPKPCTSFEEFVASAAAADYVRRIELEEPLLFTLGDVLQINRFFSVKSDLTSVVNEADADSFIASVAQFIQRVKTATEPIYDTTIQQDPDQAQRGQNLAAAETALDDAKHHGSVHVVPHASNTGFRNVQQVPLGMYRMADPQSPGSGTQVKQIQLGLPSSSERFLDYGTALDSDAGDNVTSNEENVLGTSKTDRSALEPLFVLGAKGDANNPFVSFDDPSDFGKLHAVVFTIDLPGKTQREANRLNNVGGFFYYVLDQTTTPTPPPPSAAGTLPLPIPDPNHDLLNPDTQCDPTPLMTATQTASAAQVAVLVRNTSSQTLTNVVVCSDLAFSCSNVPVTLAPGSAQTITIPFTQAFTSNVQESHATVYATDQNGHSVQIASAQQVVNTLSPIAIQLFDASPLSDVSHPFSRFLTNHDSNAQDKPLRGATTDGTDKSVRIAIQGLKPSAQLEVSIEDAQLPEVVDGVGQITDGTNSGTDLLVTSDANGQAELFYTPPSFFIRPAEQKYDFDAVERQVTITVHQDLTGTSLYPIVLRRPPVFLLHGLGGTIDAFDAWQPLVPPRSTGEYYHARSGFDGRFDLFDIGTPFTSRHVRDEVPDVISEIKLSLQSYEAGFAIGKFDLIAHSMGGLISRNMTNSNALVRDAVRKLIILNSPLGGSPLADQVVKVRDQAIVDLKGISNPFDLWDPKSFNPANPAAPLDIAKGLFKANLCYLGIQSIGRTPRFNLFNGALDDLQTNVSPFVIAGGNEVPTHHIVTTTTEIANPLSTLGLPAFGASSEVVWLWRGLGFACGWIPDNSLLEAAIAQKAATKALFTAVGAIAGAAGGGGEALTGEAADAQQIESILKGVKGIGSTMFDAVLGDPPTPIFTGDNDRVVPVTSQLEGLDHLDPTVSEVFGFVDHQAAKITQPIPLIGAQPILGPSACIAPPDGTGVPHFATPQPPKDISSPADAVPDVVCHVISLLEADPHGTFFKQP